MGEAFDNLAMASTAKQSTMDQMVKAIADLTDANARLTKANQTLTQQLKKAMDGNGGGQRSNNTNTNTQESKRFPPWTDPDAYCHTCGYKLRIGHNSTTCPKAKNHPGHKAEATRSNPMGGSLKDAGWGSKPDGTKRQ